MSLTAVSWEEPTVFPDRKEAGMKLMLVIAVAVGLLAGAPAAHAEETTCQGSIGAVTVDNLRVPDGAKCVLTGTLVEGTIKVETDARLVARNVSVIGNIQGEDAAKIKVKRGSSVNGDIQHVQGGGAKIVDTIVGGTLFLDENEGRLKAKRNVIEGNLQAFQNLGGLKIADNVIDGNLQCKENDPPPTGGGNVVQGNKEDQCATL
jgi:hypothetical protein